MLNIQVRITGDKRVLAQLKNIEGAFSDWKPELQAVADYLVDFYKDPVFETEGGIFGARWQALSPAYQAKKSTLYPGRGILEASGNLRRSFESRVYSNMLSILNTAKNKQGEPYGSYHQEGKGVPKRLLINVDDKTKKNVVDIFKKGVLIKLQNAIKKP